MFLKQEQDSVKFILEDEGSHPVDEILAYRPAAGDVCAGRRRCLAEGAHEEIYIPDTSV